MTLTAAPPSDLDSDDGRVLLGHRPLTGTIRERFAEVVARMDGRLTDPTHATAICWMCGCDAVSISISDDQLRLLVNCSGRAAFEDGNMCWVEELIGAYGLALSDLFAGSRRTPKPSYAKPLRWFQCAREELVLMTGSAREALTLQTILFWLERATIFEDERWWTAINHAALAEATGFDEQQIRKRAIPRLVEQKLIRRIDGSFNGKRTTRYALEEDTYLARLAEALAEVDRRRLPEEDLVDVTEPGLVDVTEPGLVAPTVPY